MNLKAKLLNFWYYYKYYVLGAVMAILVLAIALNSCFNRKDYDVNVLYVTHGYSDTFYQGDELISVFDTYAPDINGDGKISLSDLAAIQMHLLGVKLIG